MLMTMKVMECSGHSMIASLHRRRSGVRYWSCLNTHRHDSNTFARVDIEVLIKSKCQSGSMNKVMRLIHSVEYRPCIAAHGRPRDRLLSWERTSS